MIDVYAELWALLCRAGQAGSAPGVELAKIRSLEPFSLYVGGAVLSRGILCPPSLLSASQEGSPLAVGDAVAIQRLGDRVLVLCREVEV